MTPSLSIIIVSFNTKDILRRCLQALFQYSQNLTTEIIVVDNASHDGSQEMVSLEFPSIRLVESAINLGFAAANNLGFRLSHGRYIVMLNSDAFIHADTLHNAFKHMENDPLIGLGGARLMGEDGAWQPSARMLPSLLNDFLHLSGLAAKYPHSHFFGRADATWAPIELSRQCGWVPGTFSIVRRNVLEKINYFDERFYLYFEEVDLCQRIHRAGYAVWYWGDVLVTHLGGESSKAITHLSLAKSGKQLTLWKMRSQLLYYRKQGGPLKAWLSAQMEMAWHKLRAWKNRRTGTAENLLKANDSDMTIQLIKKAWDETKGGTVSPPIPW